MTGRIINLRTRRKQKARADKAKTADARAVQHGEAKAERLARKAEESRAARILDSVRLRPDDTSSAEE